ncbi:MAG TPA: hypothetical protein VGD25_09630 [Immundisolibacter sp.]
MRSEAPLDRAAQAAGHAGLAWKALDERVEGPPRTTGAVAPGSEFLDDLAARD